MAYMTFEDTTQGLISKMDSLGLDVSGDFEMNRLRIYPLEEPSAYSEPGRGYVNRCVNNIMRRPPQR